MLTLIASVIAIGASCLWLAKFLQTIYLSPLSAIPNAHFSASHSRLWLIWLKRTGHEHRARYAVHRRLGPVVRIAPQELSVNCVDGGIQTIYGGGFDKAAWYSNLQNYGNSFMFSMLPSKPHSERKRRSAHVYSNSYIHNSAQLKQILHTMISERYLPQMRIRAEKGVPFNIYQENKSFFMDTTTAYFFGLGNGTNLLGDPQQKGTLRRFELGLKGLFWLLEVPGLTKWASRVGKKFVADAVMESYEFMENLCLEMCTSAKKTFLHESKGSRSASHPIVYGQLRHKVEESGAPAGASETIVAAELLDQIQAGHEGTAITVTFLMCELAKSSDIRAKLYTELSMLGDNPSLQNINSLPYLDAILMETLRRYPGTLGPFPRSVPDSGTILGGFDVPGGTTVSASVYSLHRNPDVSPKPEEWRPERWIQASVEERKEMMRWFWVFGSGGRMCIGNHLAIHMMKALIFAVYSEFEAIFVPETKIEPIDGLMADPASDMLLLAFKKISSPKN